mmetsp:Transcript_22676/g.62610  ORF Transcript_22676/g.62610 Transcript_22676/m.62610 type:complete len:206 (-) Transcript_22676:521-1138(-)
MASTLPFQLLRCVLLLSLTCCPLSTSQRRQALHHAMHAHLPIRMARDQGAFVAPQREAGHASHTGCGACVVLRQQVSPGREDVHLATGIPEGQEAGRPLRGGCVCEVCDQGDRGNHLGICLDSSQQQEEVWPGASLGFHQRSVAFSCAPTPSRASMACIGERARPWHAASYAYRSATQSHKCSLQGCKLLLTGSYGGLRHVSLLP